MNTDRMHCQCCDRAILAKPGTIAHHGYTRPHTGWQTRSCMGAKRLPFEVSRDRLGEMIRFIEADAVRSREYLASVEAETVALPFRYSTYEGWGKSVKRSVDVTRETFDDVRAAYTGEMRKYGVHDFDDIKKRLCAPPRAKLLRLSWNVKNSKPASTAGVRRTSAKVINGWRCKAPLSN